MNKNKSESKSENKLNRKDWDTIQSLIYKASRKDLEEMGDRISNEICLSDMAIEEGYEKDE
jgi:hypothetical protein